MDKYIEAFNAYAQEHEPGDGCPNVGNILKMLYCCYRQQKGGDRPIVKAYFDELYRSAEKVLPGSGEEVIVDASKLCAALEEQAFLEGFTVGFRLYNGLYKQLG